MATSGGKRSRFVSFHFDRLVSCLTLSLQHNDMDIAKLLFVQLLPVLARIPELMIRVRWSTFVLVAVFVGR
jgi:hypothetical protein